MKRSTPIREYSNTQTDISKIKAVACNPNLAESEVFDFPPFVIARSGRNHNRTEITAEAQRAAVGGWIGKAVYFKDHETTASNQIGRIYHAWVDETGGETVTHGRAFAIRTDEDAALQSKIANRIHREMSCGYDVLKSSCNLCGLDTAKIDCPTHATHADYFAKDIEIAPDHISFVGRPAIDGAGLSMNSRKDDETERLVADGREYRKIVSDDFARWYRANNPGSDLTEIDGITASLTVDAMRKLARIQKDRFSERIPDGRQQLTAPQETEQPVNAPQYKSIRDVFKRG